MRRRPDDLLFLLAHRLRARKRADRIRRRRRTGLAVGILVGGTTAAVLAAGFGAGAALSSTCDLNALRPVDIGANSFVYDRWGNLLGSIPAERNREPVALGQMTPWLPRATVAIEDRRFYAHGGVDYVGIARAAWTDLTTGKTLQGGSTLTQQLVRNLYTGQEKTFRRKLKEACLAIKLARRWPKEKILTDYLNVVYYGNHAYGVEAAAQTYFSRHARDLTLLQAALIAGLPQAPSDYDPFHNPSAALARRGEVLNAMLANGAITATQYAQGIASRSLGLRPGRIYTRIKEPYFFSYVIDRLEQQYGSNTVREGGLKVYTTLDPRLQRAALKSMREILTERTDPASAIVSVEPGSGAIRAMTAQVPPNPENLQPGTHGNEINLAAQAARQAGSTFKVFALAQAIAEGMDPDSTYYTSGPFTCATGAWCNAQTPWHVETYGHTYLGTTSVTRATLASDNTIYAQLALDAGPDKIYALAKRMGIHFLDTKSQQTPVASIELGVYSVTPLDMAAAYAAFAANGIWARPNAITKVVLPNGKTDGAWGKPETKRVLPDGVAWKVNQVLQENAQYGTGAGSCDGVHPCAGKTGTTENHADAWFIGYTHQLSTAVWMGYLRGDSERYAMESVHGVAVAGATFAVPIWHEYMRAALYRKLVIPFAEPRHYPEYSYWHKNYFGYVYTYSPPVAATTTAPATPTTPAAPLPPPRPAAPAATVFSRKPQ